MRKYFIAWTLGFACICVFAQLDNRSGDDFYSLRRSVDEKFRARDWSGALVDIDKCRSIAKDSKDTLISAMYGDLVLMKAYCYGYLAQYGEERAVYDELLSSDRSSQRVREKVYALYTGCALRSSSALLSEDKKDYPAIYALLRTALDYSIDEEASARLHEQLGMAYYFEGCDKMLERENEEAELAYGKALGQFELAEDKENMISVLRQLGSIHKSNGHSEDALKAYGKVTSLSLELNDITSAVSALKDQSLIYEARAEYEKSIAVSLRINTLMHGTHDPESIVANNLDLADEAYQKWGNPDLAETLLMKCLELIPALDSLNQVTWNHDIALKLSNLYSGQGKYKEALRFDSIASAYYLRSMDEESPFRYLAYGRRASLYAKSGERDSAFKYIPWIVNQKAAGQSVNVVSGQYRNRGLAYALLDEYDLAMKDYEYADRLLKQAYPDMDIRRSGILYFKGGVLYKQKKYEEARSCYEEYANLCKHQYGANSTDYADAVYYLANIKAFCGDIEGGQHDFMESVDLLRAILKNDFCYIPAYGKERYWADLSDKFLAMAGFALRSKAFQNRFTLSAYDALLLSKGLLLQTDRSLVETLREEGNQEDLDLYFKMRQTWTLLMDLQKDSPMNSVKIQELSAELDRMEKLLAQKSSRYTDYSSIMSLCHDDIRRSLKKHEIVIDITDFNTENNVRQYAAFLLKKEWEYPLLLPLCRQGQMDTLMLRANLHVDELYKSPLAGEVLRLVWDRIAGYVSPGSTVYYVPSGFIHQIALESLPVADGSLLGEKYHFTRLTSAREICLGDERGKFKPKSAVLYGGLQYDMDSAAMLSESRKYEIPALMAMRGMSMRGDSIYRLLPMAGEEVREIDKLLRSKGVRVDLRTVVSGTEESFMSLDGKSPHIIHIATHGFYYHPQEAARITALRGYKDAMLLSGLILSGGNAGWRGIGLPAGVMDGILTAAEISSLNLKGSGLVVLSACETGKGKVTSEGLYGLQRAFKKAGTQTIIMTLWPVSDLVTKKFMVYFYKNLVKYKWNKRKAFKSAKSQIREEYEEPYYWAGFVVLD